nr:MAG TPA: hypothetical protein [Caudoviricetes sp.]
MTFLLKLLLCKAHLHSIYTQNKFHHNRKKLLPHSQERLIHRV